MDSTKKLSVIKLMYTNTNGRHIIANCQILPAIATFGASVLEFFFIMFVLKPICHETRLFRDSYVITAGSAVIT